MRKKNSTAPKNKKGSRASSIQIPGYEIREKIGEGGMGVVYKAWQKNMERWVAIKVLHRHLSMSKEHIQKFRQEAKILSRMSHKNIVASIAMGRQGKLHYFVMEYVKGTPLSEALQKGPLPEKEIFSIAKQMADALYHIHSRGYVHADIKPHNILRLSNGIIKIMDFGLATPIGQVPDKDKQAVGTPYYISPEQAKGVEPLYPPSDIYSLGATLYHLAVGAPPFEGESPMVVMTRHLTERVVPPIRRNRKIPPSLNQLILKMMEPLPASRFQNALELKKAIEEAEANPQKGGCLIPFEREVYEKKALKQRRHYRSLNHLNLTILLVVLSAVIGFGGFLTFQYLQKLHGPISAQEEETAWRLLREASQYKRENPEDIPGILARYQRVFQAYPGTQAAMYAKKVWQEIAEKTKQ